MSTIRSAYKNQVLVLHVDEKVSGETFDQLNPLVESILEDHSKLRFLIILDDFKGWDAAGFWQDIAFDIKHSSDIERIAVVGNLIHDHIFAMLAKPFTEAKVKYFKDNQHYEARQWITENLDNSDRIHFDLDDEKGILTVRLNHPVEAEDFAVLEDMFKSYNERKGQLNGILIDAEFFSGWDSFHTFVEQFKFIKEHHKDVDRVALVCPPSLASESLPHLLNHFLNSEIEHFTLDSIGLNWLKQPPECR